MPSSSLHGGINNVPWQAPPRPRVVMRGRRFLLLMSGLVNRINTALVSIWSHPGARVEAESITSQFAAMQSRSDTAFGKCNPHIIHGCNPSSAHTGSGWYLSGVLAAWMPPSSLQGGINGVTWQVLPRPKLVISGRRITPIIHHHYKDVVSI